MDLGRNSLGDEGTEIIATELKESGTSKLLKLLMSSNGIGRKGAIALAEYIAVTASLTSLTLSYNNIKGSGKAIGDALNANTSLREILMNKCNLGNKDVTDMAGGLAAHSSLTAVDLMRNRFGADKASMLLKVKRLTTLCGFRGDETSIDFNMKGIGPAGAMLIAPEVGRMTSLRSLLLDGNDVGPEGAKAIAPAIAGSASITNVSLISNQLCGLYTDWSDKKVKGTFDASGIDALANAVKVNTSLTSLNIRFNDLGEEGSKALAPGVAGSASLTELNISRNRIGNAGAAAIAGALETNKALKMLMVDGEAAKHAALVEACKLRGVTLC